MKKTFLNFLILTTTIFFSAVNAVEICNDKQVLGVIEKVQLAEQHVVLDAKLDTGADMSSLSATDVSMFTHDNKTFVHFTVYIPAIQQKIILNAPLIDYARIRVRHEANTTQEYVDRPVISLPVCINKQRVTLPMNLTDRTNLEYPMLIGKDVLERLHILVDVSQKYSVTPDC